MQVRLLKWMERTRRKKNLFLKECCLDEEGAWKIFWNLGDMTEEVRARFQMRFRIMEVRLSY